MRTNDELTLCVQTQRLAVCRLDSAASLPGWALDGPGFVSITRAGEELSLVCAEELVPGGVEAEKGWQALRVAGSLDLSLTGVLYSILEPLSRERIGVFVLSTFETDYILIKTRHLESAVQALSARFRVLRQ